MAEDGGGRLMLHFELGVRERQRAMWRFDGACLHDFQQLELLQRPGRRPGLADLQVPRSGTRAACPRVRKKQRLAWS